jgi:hypothetical protein
MTLDTGSALANIRELLNDQDDWTRQKAMRALQYHEQYTNGQLNEYEYKDLMEDLVRTDTINDLSNQMKFKANVEKLLTIVSKLY